MVKASPLEEGHDATSMSRIVLCYSSHSSYDLSLYPRDHHFLIAFEGVYRYRQKGLIVFLY